MEYSLWILLAFCCVTGLMSKAHGLPSPTDYPEDEDYNYDNYDDKSEGVDDAVPESNDIRERQDPPYFEKTELTVKAHFGEDVFLECDVRNFHLSNLIMWSKESNFIVNGQTSMNDRIVAFANNTIKILKVQQHDTGEYRCTVLPENIVLRINLEISGALAIYSGSRDVTEKTITVRQGGSVLLECKTFVSGDSTIKKWSLNGERVEKHGISVDQGMLTIDKVGAEHAGIYQCLGDDGSMRPLHGSVTIDVHYTPKVFTHRHHVNTEAGEKAKLDCYYRASPIAVIQWKRRGIPIDSFSDKHMVQYVSHGGHNRTILTVKDVEAADLGEYECQAKNTIGTNETRIHLIYEPENPTFENQTIEGNTVTLLWLVRSIQPLSEAIMDYKINGTYTWSSETIIRTTKHPEHTGIWKLRHQIELIPGLWHARVKTKNTMGWSRFSAQHTFKIDDVSEIGEIVQTAGIGKGLSSAKANGGDSNAKRLSLLIFYLSALGVILRTLCHSTL